VPPTNSRLPPGRTASVHPLRRARSAPVNGRRRASTHPRASRGSCRRWHARRCRTRDDVLLLAPSRPLFSVVCS
jgi:hypothetical protein